MSLRNFINNIVTSKKKLSADLDEALATATELAEELDRTKAELYKTLKKVAAKKPAPAKKKK